MLERRYDRLVSAAFFKAADARRNNRPSRNKSIVPPNRTKINADAKFFKAKWAEKLGVSTFGYYTWLHDRKRRQAAEDTRREKVIAAFREGQGVYGVDRICGILRRAGDSASCPAVKRIMAQEGLKSCHCRCRQRL